MRLRTRLVLVSCAAAVALLGAAAPAQAQVVLAQGYVAALDAQYNGGQLRPVQYKFVVGGL